MIQLLNGKVLTLTSDPPFGQSVTATEVYDPTQNGNGKWAKEPPPADLGWVSASVLITEVSSSVEGGTCAPNCGKVLMLGNPSSSEIQTLWLYDPASTQPTKWSKFTSGPPYEGLTADMVLITGPGCGNNCGKVLVTTGIANFQQNNAPTVRLFNPKVLTFEVLPWNSSGPDLKVVAVLPTGKILLHEKGVGPWLYDPALSANNPGLFTRAGNPGELAETKGEVLTTTRGPEVLVMNASQRGALIYNHSSGQWRSAPPCGVPALPTPIVSATYCFLLTTLKTGKVLAKSMTVGDLQENGRRLSVFDPESSVWTHFEQLWDEGEPLAPAPPQKHRSGHSARKTHSRGTTEATAPTTIEGALQ
jgi:hypothetical protein